MREPMTCPACGGQGYQEGAVRAVPGPNGEPLPEQDITPCGLCHGEGLVRIFPASQEMVPASALDAAQAEAATLRRALAWLADNAGGKFNDCPVAATGDCEAIPVGWCEERMVRPDGEVSEPECKQDRDECTVADCWVQAALAAAQEGEST